MQFMLKNLKKLQWDKMRVFFSNNAFIKEEGNEVIDISP